MVQDRQPQGCGVESTGMYSPRVRLHRNRQLSRRVIDCYGWSLQQQLLPPGLTASMVADKT